LRIKYSRKKFYWHIQGIFVWGIFIRGIFVQGKRVTRRERKKKGAIGIKRGKQLKKLKERETGRVREREKCGEK
jgi:hypothetical protein